MRYKVTGTGSSGSAPPVETSTLLQDLFNTDLGAAVARKRRELASKGFAASDEVIASTIQAAFKAGNRELLPNFASAQDTVTKMEVGS